MNGRQRSLRGLALALAVLTLAAVVWTTLAPGAGRGTAPEQVLAGMLPALDGGAARAAAPAAAACYTIDTSRPEWLGRSTYLPVVLREY